MISYLVFILVTNKDSLRTGVSQCSPMSGRGVLCIDNGHNALSSCVNSFFFSSFFAIYVAKEVVVISHTRVVPFLFCLRSVVLKCNILSKSFILLP